MRRYYKTPQSKHRSNTAFINIYGKKKKKTIFLATYT